MIPQPFTNQEVSSCNVCDKCGSDNVIKGLSESRTELKIRCAHCNVIVTLHVYDFGKGGRGIYRGAKEEIPLNPIKPVT